ncbi:EAL domain-containing protein [Oceanospirillaceae bacterium ASx5O]|nr:EAL domain-containing protein [Oceanospirillaceae bacterium ASx5O]
MTLRQQFSILTGLLVLILLSGSLLLTLSNARSAFEQQLNARAYDAATSLALSMSQTAGDRVQLQRQMDALFDRGFFALIELQATDGSQLQRRADDVVSVVPDWLPRLFALDLLVAEADVTSGWQRLGTLRVLSHSGPAYQDLWTMVRHELQWYGLVLVLSLLLLQWLLRWLLRPLAEVEKQAQAICNRQWPVQRNIPKARELRQMVLAMNQMVKKLRTIFTEQAALTEQLRAETFSDSLSGLLNRRGFDQRLEHILQRRDGHSGVLLLLQLQQLAELNQQQGRQAADDLLHSLGRQLGFWLQGYSAAFAGRRSGSDFALYLPCTGKAQAAVLAEQLYDQLSTTVLSRRQGLVFHLGGVVLQGEQESPAQALSCADAALRQAQHQATGGVKLYDGDNANAELTAGEWRTMLLQVLQNEGLQLLFQPVLAADGKTLQQLEVFSRIEWQGQSFSAGRFWPMVEQHHLAAQFDALIVRNVLRQLQQQVLPAGVRCCVNISPASVLNDAFQRQLQQWLAAAPEAAARLALELPESSLPGTEAALLRLADVVQPFGVALGVDQVGTGSMAFAYLQRLPLQYLRIDGSFNRGLAQAGDHRFFVQSMVQIAHSLDLQVLAEGVEQPADVQALQQVGVGGLSGYAFSRPSARLQDALNWQPA